MSVQGDSAIFLLRTASVNTALMTRCAQPIRLADRPLRFIAAMISLMSSRRITRICRSPIAGYTWLRSTDWYVAMLLSAPRWCWSQASASARKVAFPALGSMKTYAFLSYSTLSRKFSASRRSSPKDCSRCLLVLPPSVR